MAEGEDKTTRALQIVKQHALSAIGVSIVPLPLVDVALLSGIQIAMLYRLAELYGVDFVSNARKPVLASVLGGGLSFSLSANLATLLRSLPRVGLIAGLISTPLFGAAATYAVGRVFIQHFESGSTFLTFDPQRVRAYFVEQFEAGKEEMRTSFAGIRP
ncbi:GTPase [Candidatus Entotheonella serta]|nr:GTPase [Candidatus Entotheonella serta]